MRVNLKHLSKCSVLHSLKPKPLSYYTMTLYYADTGSSSLIIEAVVGGAIGTSLLLFLVTVLLVILIYAIRRNSKANKKGRDSIM